MVRRKLHPEKELKVSRIKNIPFLRHTLCKDFLLQAISATMRQCRGSNSSWKEFSVTSSIDLLQWLATFGAYSLYLHHFIWPDHLPTLKMSSWELLKIEKRRWTGREGRKNGYREKSRGFLGLLFKSPRYFFSPWGKVFWLDPHVTLLTLWGLFGCR